MLFEFEDHRPFYNWLLENLNDYTLHRPRQIEFARLNITNTIMSKRYFKRLVDEGIVDGWDDPRMPTLSGLRRRGVTPLLSETSAKPAVLPKQIP